MALETDGKSNSNFFSPPAHLYHWNIDFDIKEQIHKISSAVVLQARGAVKVEIIRIEVNLTFFCIYCEHFPTRKLHHDTDMKAY